MFTGVVDSRDVRTRRGSSSQISGCTSSRYRCTEQDAVIKNLQEALRVQNEYNLRQQEYHRQQQEYFAKYTTDQQAWIAVSMISEQLAFRQFITLCY